MITGRETNGQKRYASTETSFVLCFDGRDAIERDGEPGHMTDEGVDQDVRERERPSGPSLEGGTSGQRSEALSADELFFRKLPTQRFGGYDCDAVDLLLDRAARTIDSLARERKKLAGEIEASRTSAPVVDEAVSQMLMKMQRLMDEERDLAHRAAAELVAQAQAQAEEAERLRLEAQSELDRARVQAEAILVAARADREHLVATWRQEADDARAAAEQERQQIDATIAGRREEWASRVKEALARLDNDLAVRSASDGDHPDGAESYELTPTDLAAELSERAGGAGGRSAQPDASS
jgi:DivIVA domain-containing protein